MNPQNKIIPTNRPISVLLDLSVYRLGMIVEGAIMEKTVPFGDSTYTIQITGMKRKSFKGDSKKIQDQEYMPTITRLMREGFIKVYKYS